MKRPGPDHPISIVPSTRQIQVHVGEFRLAQSRRALLLSEASMSPVAYLPRSDVDMFMLQRSEHTTYCPYKGTANYFDIVLPGGVKRNAVWTYENPYPDVSLIASFLAFYSNIARITQQD